MKRANSLNKIMYFLLYLYSAIALFFYGTGLKEPLAKMIIYMNSGNANTYEWIVNTISGLVVAIFFCALTLISALSVKKLLEQES